MIRGPECFPFHTDWEMQTDSFLLKKKKIKGCTGLARAWSGEWARCSASACPPGPSPTPLTPPDHRRRESSAVLEQPRKCQADRAAVSGPRGL